MQFLQVVFSILRVVFPLILARQKVKPNLGETRWILNLVCMAGLRFFGHHKVVLGWIDKGDTVVVRCEALGIAFNVALDLLMVDDRIFFVDHLCNVLGFALALRLDPSGVEGALVEVNFDEVEFAGSRFVGFSSFHAVDSSKLDEGCKRES